MSISRKLGIGSPETLRKWVRRAEIDAGQRPGVTTEESEQLARSSMLGNDQSGMDNRARSATSPPATSEAGYPASAVGGTAVRSNLNPPSPFALSLAQAGRVDRRAGAADLPDSPECTGHGAAGDLGGSPLAGLPDLPDVAGCCRLAWIPVIALVLVVLLAGLRRVIGLVNPPSAVEPRERAT